MVKRVVLNGFIWILGMTGLMYGIYFAVPVVLKIGDSLMPAFAVLVAVVAALWGGFVGIYLLKPAVEYFKNKKTQE